MVTERLEELGENINSFEAKQSWPQGFLRAVVRTDGKRTVPNLDRAKKICDALGLEFYIGPPRPQVGASGFAEAAQTYLAGIGKESGLEEGYLTVPFHTADLANKGLSPLAVSQAWIHDLGIDADHLTAVRMPDADMEPAVPEGQLLLVDGRFRPEPEATLCAFTVNGRLHVGWLVLPRAGALAAFFQRAFTPPLVRHGKTGPPIECLGRIVARLDTLPSPWLDAEEKARLFQLAKSLVNKT